jgi:hypothetical protein
MYFMFVKIAPDLVVCFVMRKEKYSLEEVQNYVRSMPACSLLWRNKTILKLRMGYYVSLIAANYLIKQNSSTSNMGKPNIPYYIILLFAACRTGGSKIENTVLSYTTRDVACRQPKKVYNKP